jgi:hypothetical protein
MTFEEAREIARQGIKVNHMFFTPEEYMTMKDNIIIFEDGTEIDWNDWASGLDYLLDGWELFEKNLPKITTPKDMVKDISKLNEVLQKFEGAFLKKEKGESYYHIVILGEYNRAILDEVIKVYENAGWLVLSCKTSSEDGERPGLTGLQLKIK